jgi:hypothetical protein
MDPRLDTGDWAQVFGEGDCQSDMRVEVCVGSGANGAAFTREDVAEILHFYSDPVDHDADGLGDWDGCVIVRLKDGRYAACSGWCDFSGWG